jgi:hypothetical protein
MARQHHDQAWKKQHVRDVRKALARAAARTRRREERPAPSEATGAQTTSERIDLQLRDIRREAWRTYLRR